MCRHRVVERLASDGYVCLECGQVLDAAASDWDAYIDEEDEAWDGEDWPEDWPGEGERAEDTRN